MLLVGEIEREPNREPRVRIGGEHSNWMSVDEFVRWDSDMRWARGVQATGLISSLTAIPTGAALGLQPRVTSFVGRTISDACR